MAGLDKLHILLRLANKQAKQTMKNSSSVRGCAKSDTFGVGLVYL